jgi:carbon-monoxide dehydrogenase catalytic subunit
LGECLDNARASTFFRAIANASGEPLKRLPLAFSSPEWSNEKGLGAAMGFRLLGLNSYHCIAPPLDGSDKVARFFFEDTQELLGAVMVIDPNPTVLAQRIIADFDARRAALGWQASAPPATLRQSALQHEKESPHHHPHTHHHATEDHHHD